MFHHITSIAILLQDIIGFPARGCPDHPVNSLEHFSVALDQVVPVHANLTHLFISQDTTVYHGFKVHL